jgi:hypothetical protein
MLSDDVVRWVPGYEGRYTVSRNGEVFSAARTFDRLNRGRHQTVRVPARMLVQCLNRNGYPFVRLYKDNRGRTFEVHRLVCRAFHDEPEPGQEASHINGVRSDCRAANLEWVSRADNHAMKRAHGTHLIGTAVPNAKLDEFKAIEICRRAWAGESMRGLGREFRITDRAVRKIKFGQLWGDYTLAVRTHLKGQTDE